MIHHNYSFLYVIYVNFKIFFNLFEINVNDDVNDVINVLNFFFNPYEINVNDVIYVIIINDVINVNDVIIMVNDLIFF